jgi:hypothetical protein
MKKMKKKKKMLMTLINNIRILDGNILIYLEMAL